MKTVSIIGAGNIASWFSYAMQKAGFKIRQIYSYTLENAEKLASFYHAEPISDVAKLEENSDLYLFSLKDDLYLPVLEQMDFTIPFAVHTAGSVSQDIFKNFAGKFGVLYPYQAISKKIDFTNLEVPLCVEANTIENRNLLKELALQLSGKVYCIDEKQRLSLHLAAVFASNFTNAMYEIAYKILQKENIDWDIILPLLENTLNKIKTNAPAEVQTGPAVRNDQLIMRKHLALLPDEEIQNVYKQISAIIYKTKQMKDDSGENPE